MKKIMVLLIVILIIFFPVSVKARVICNDGWISSCVVSGPGCCSWHGGVAYSNRYDEYDDEDYEYSEDYNNDESNNENTNGGITIFLIIIIFAIVIGFCS